MTTLRHQVLNGSRQPIAGLKATVRLYDPADAPRPGSFERARVVSAVSNSQGWLTWTLPTPTDDRFVGTPTYIVTGIEDHQVLVSVPLTVSTTTVTATRIGTVPVTTPPATVDLVTEEELAARLAGLPAGLTGPAGPPGPKGDPGSSATVTDAAVAAAWGAATGAKAAADTALRAAFDARYAPIGSGGTSAAASDILTKVQRALRSKIRPNQGIAVELSGTSYRLWQRLSPGQWLGTYLDVRANTNGGNVNIINQNVVVTPSVLVSQGNAGITQVGTWTVSGASVWSATATDSQTFTAPANTTGIGVEYLRLTNGGLSKVSINGDATRARLLPTAQDLVERGLYAKTILVANGGTLQPTDRVIDHYWSGGASQTVNVLAAEDLPPTTTGHVIVLTPTGYQQTASTGARSYFVGFLHRQAQTLGDTTALQVLTLDPGAGSSATEYAISGKPVATGATTFMGCIHDNEAQDSLSVTVDGSAATLVAGAAPVFPISQVTITKVSHLLHPSATGSVANITTTYILTRDGLAVDVNLVWQQAMTIAAAYSMLPLNGKLGTTGSAARASFDRGDLLESGAGPLRLGGAPDAFLGTSKSAAAWMWESLGRVAAGFYLDDVLAFTNNWVAAGGYFSSIEDRNGTMAKAYISRVGSGGGANVETVGPGTTWAWRAHYLVGLMDSPERTFAA